MITIPSFVTSAVINGNTLIKDADGQLNIMMGEMKTYVEETYQYVIDNISTDVVANTIIDDDIIANNKAWTSDKIANNATRIGFDLSNTTTPSVGQMAWNIDESTIDLGVNNATIQIGQEMLIKVRADSTILNGQVVMVTGSIGNSGRITVAPHDGVINNGKRVLGVATQDIALGVDGFVTAFGKVRGINTTGVNVGETWKDGDVLYIKPNGGGNLTIVPPTDTEINMPIAYVVKAHSSGTLFVRINGVDENLIKAWVQSRLDLKADVASPTFSGIVTAPKFSGSFIGNASTATKLDSTRTFTLTGDVTGTITSDLTSGVSITTTIAPNSVALGTDTTGNYVAGVTAGQGITISGTAGEGWSPTITNTAPNVTTDISITHNASSVVVNSSDGLDGTINAATSILAGIMTAADKTKLDGIATGATANTGTVTSIATTGAITGGTITTTGTISHSTADGFLHVPATGTTNNGKVLTAGATAGSLSWTTIPSAQVTSVAGKTGNVTLVKGDVGLGSVDNTADSSKNVLSATKLTTAITINGASFDGTANITVSDNTKLTKTNPVITGSITEQVYNLTGTEINPANGTIQYKTVSANTTFTETLTSGQSVLLRLIGASSYTITFPTITWVGAVAPTLTANCAIVLWKEQSTLYGSFVGTLV